MTLTGQVMLPQRPKPAGTAPRSAPLLSSRWGTGRVTGVGAVLPLHGVGDANELLAPGRAREFDAVAAFGRKGLRYRDKATLLGTAAAEAAMDDAGLLTARAVPGQPSYGLGLVVGTCWGNVDTVCSVAAAINAGGVAAISPMDLPNASSNIVTSSIAIRNGIRGVCLTVCNGGSTGWDALRWGLSLLASGRCSDVAVVGVEVRSPAERILRASDKQLVEGAAAVVLSRTSDQPAPGRSHPQARLFPNDETAALGGVVDIAAAVLTARQNSRTSRSVTTTMPESGVPWTVHP